MRYYSNLAQEMTLTAGVAAGDTVLNLSSVTGLPSAFPFTLVIDPGASNEEVVTCTALFGTSATVQRGSDGTSATAHSAAAKVRHMLTKRDLSEPQEHIAATTDVHGTGAGSAVVGTTSIQTLTNKTLDGATNTFTNLPKASLPSDTVYTGATQTLTNKTLSNPTLTGTTNAGTVNLSGGINVPSADVTAGDLTVVAARSWRNRAKNNNGKTYEYRVSQDVNANPGIVYHVLYEDGVEAGRFDLYNGKMRYRASATASFQDVQLVDDSTISSFLSTASGWSNGASNLRVRNGVAYLTIVFSRTGADIASSTSSGAVADTLVCTMNAGYRPGAVQITAAQYGGTNGGFCNMSTDGTVRFFHGAPGVALATGDTLIATFTFPL